MYQTQYKNNKIPVRSTVIQERIPFFPSLWSFVVYQKRYTPHEKQLKGKIEKQLNKEVGSTPPGPVFAKPAFGCPDSKYNFKTSTKDTAVEVVGEGTTTTETVDNSLTNIENGNPKPSKGNNVGRTESEDILIEDSWKTKMMAF